MFYSDKPIPSSKEDVLNRSNFAGQLARALVSLNNEDTFTVGLFGKWGSGKTSLVNMTLQEIENLQKESGERIIIIHFEPWNFSDTEQLLTQFFIHLSNVLKSKKDEGLKKVGDALEKYSDAFGFVELIPGVGIKGKIGAFFAKKIAASTGRTLKKNADEKDVLKQKKIVEESLKKQTDRILVVIDDIDRLSNEQIRSVFQLITSVAKFPNVTYLLAFDKQVVVKALEEVQRGDGEAYLEKIIQIPIHLPEIQKAELRRLLFDKLDVILKNCPDISFEENHWRKLFESCIDPFIKNLRDVNRLCNTLQFKLGTIYSEVNFADMVAITSIEIGMPVIYEWIRNNKDILTGSHNYSLAILDKKEPKEWLADFQMRIRLLLQNGNADKMVEDDLTIVIKAVADLFPFWGNKIGKSYEGIDFDRYRKNNQISHPEKFDRYFQLNLEEVKIKKEDVQNAVNMVTEEELIALLLEQDKKGLSYEFLEEVKAVIIDMSNDRTKVIARALFRASRQLGMISQKNLLSTSASEYADYMLIKLLSKLSPEERYPFILNEIENSEINALQTAAIIINKFELGEGRLSANGEKRIEYNGIIQLEELLKLETAFCKRVKKVLEWNNLFDIREWKTIVHLLESFDPEYIKNYFAKSFEEDGNVLEYMDSSITHWTGDGDAYEIREKYKLYLTKERILEAIEYLVKVKAFFDLSETVQNKCAAFYLHSNGKVGYDGHVYHNEVDKVLNSWK